MAANPMIFIMLFLVIIVAGVAAWYFLAGPGKAKDDTTTDDTTTDDTSNLTATRTYTKLTNADFAGNSINCYKDGSNADFCKTKCDADTTCKAYDYVPKGSIWGPDTSGCCTKTVNGPVGYYEGVEFYRLDGSTSDSTSDFNGEVYTIQSMLKSTYLSNTIIGENNGLEQTSTVGTNGRWVFYPIPGQAKNVYGIRSESQATKKGTYSWIAGNGDNWDADHSYLWKDAMGGPAWWIVEKVPGLPDGVYTIRNHMRSGPSPTPTTVVYTFSYLGVNASNTISLLTTGNTAASYWKIDKAT